MYQPLLFIVEQGSTEPPVLNAFISLHHRRRSNNLVIYILSSITIRLNSIFYDDFFLWSRIPRPVIPSSPSTRHDWGEPVVESGEPIVFLSLFPEVKEEGLEVKAVSSGSLEEGCWTRVSQQQCMEDCVPQQQLYQQLVRLLSQRRGAHH